ncbi:Uncharacterised protein [Klebsiella oxytoca]|nr:Uncharacterised protein [Klebsiella oxytoca]
MFFEVLNHVDSALSVAVSLLALWQFLVAGGVEWLVRSARDPLYLYLRDNSGDKKWHQALRTKASGLICVVEGFGSILLGVVALKATPQRRPSFGGVTTCRNSIRSDNQQVIRQ